MSFFAECAQAGVDNTRLGAPAPCKEDVVYLAQQMGLTPVALSRYWTTPALKPRFTQVPPELHDALFNAAQAVHRMRTYGVALQWLAQPAPELRGRVPLSLLQTLHGAEFVSAAIERQKPPR